MNMNGKKILAVASIGGHWIQLLRIAKPLEKDYDVVYMSTHEKCAKMVEGNEFYKMQDFSRWDAWRLIPSFFHCLNIIRKVRPTAVITTGAAPGLVALLAAKCLGRKTVWIDSIANVKHLSLCGRIASHLASRTYTQWEDLASNNIISSGNVLGKETGI